MHVLNLVRKLSSVILFITVSTRGTISVWNFLPAFVCRLLLGMKLQGQSGDHPESCRLRAQIEADLRLLNRIITEDITGRLTMGDMIALFKQQRTIIK